MGRRFVGSVAGHFAGGAGVAAVLSVAAQAFHPHEARQVATLAMEQFLSRPSVVHEYRGSRRLDASGSGRRAWLEVRTHFTARSGLVYEVAAEGGSGYIRSRVLKSLLDEEQQLIARGGAAGIAITEANYQFTPETVNDEGLAVVALQARRKDRSLLSGRMFLNASNGELVRLEGRLARNPSFWLTRVDVVRTYRSIGGALMPVSLVTKGQLRLLGSSELRMTYRYSHIDEQPVPDETRRDHTDSTATSARSTTTSGFLATLPAATSNSAVTAILFPASTRGRQPRASWPARRPATTANSNALSATGR
jgi:hypothetical protein